MGTWRRPRFGFISIVGLKVLDGVDVHPTDAVSGRTIMLEIVDLFFLLLQGSKGCVVGGRGVGRVVGCVDKVFGVVAGLSVGLLPFAPRRRDRMKSSACCLSVGTPAKHTQKSTSKEHAQGCNLYLMHSFSHTYIYRLCFSARCPYKQHQAEVSWYAHTSLLCYCHKWFQSWCLLEWQQTKLSTACSYILGSVKRIEEILSLEVKCKVKHHQQSQLWLPRTEEWNRPASWSSSWSKAVQCFGMLQSIPYTKTLITLLNRQHFIVLDEAYTVIIFSVCGQSTAHSDYYTWPSLHMITS